MEIHNDTLAKIFKSGIPFIIIGATLVGTLLFSLPILVSIAFGCVIAYAYTKFTAMEERYINKRRGL